MAPKVTSPMQRIWGCEVRYSESMTILPFSSFSMLMASKLRFSVYGRRPMDTKQMSASNCSGQIIGRSGGEDGLWFPAFCGIELKYDFVIVEFTADDLCAKFEF